MFRVQKKQCKTCIYGLKSPLNVARLEAEITDPDESGFFVSYRICHHSKDICCRGFWDRHKDAFNLGRIAQRLHAVEFVEVDILK